MNSYTIAPAAISDMLDIFTYIAEQNLDAAEKLEADFYDAFELLATHPRIGCLREDLTQQLCLFWTVRRNYIVIYEPANPVTILRVVNAYRDIPALLQTS